MAHISIVEQINGKTADWMEKVSDLTLDDLSEIENVKSHITVVGDRS